MLLIIVILATIFHQASACSPVGSPSPLAVTCTCFSGISGTTCDSTTNNLTPLTSDGLQCSQVNYENCLPADASDGDWSRFVLCASMPEVQESGNALRALRCLARANRQGTGPSLAAGSDSIQALMKSALLHTQEQSLSLFNVKQASALVLADEFTSFGTPSIDREALGFEPPTPLSPQLGNFLSANLPAYVTCGLPCPCGQVRIRDELTPSGAVVILEGRCVTQSSSDPVVLLEGYAAYGRCASIGTRALARNSIASKTTFISRAITCLNSMSYESESVQLLATEVFNKLKRTAEYLTAANEGSLRLTRIRMELGHVNDGFRNSFWIGSGAGVPQQAIYMPPMQADEFYAENLDSFISTIEDTANKLQLKSVAELISGGVGQIGTQLQQYQNGLEESLAAVRQRVLSGFQSLTSELRERSKAVFEQINVESETLKETIRTQLDTLRDVQQNMIQYHEKLTTSMNRMIAKNYEVMIAGRDLAVVESLQEIASLQQQKVVELEAIALNILFIVAESFSSFQPVASPEALVEQFQTTGSRVLEGFVKVTELFLSMDAVVEKWDALINEQLFEIRLQDLRLSINLERLSESTSEMSQVFVELSRQQYALMGLAMTATNSKIPQELEQISSKAAKILPSTWDVLEATVRNLVEYDTATCKPAYLPPFLEESLQNIAANQRRLNANRSIRGNRYWDRHQVSDHNQSNLTHNLAHRASQRSLQDGDETCTLSLSQVLDQKNPINPALNPIAEDLLLEPTDENIAKLRLAYFKALDELNAECSNMLKQFAGVVSSGRYMHHLVDAIVLNMARLRLATAKAMLYADKPGDEKSSIETELEQILGGSDSAVVVYGAGASLSNSATAAQQDAAQVVNMFLSSVESAWKEELVLGVAHTASMRLLDLCNSLIYARPNLVTKLVNVCKPVGVHQLTMDADGLLQLATNLRDSLTALSGGDAYKWDDVVFDPSAGRAQGIALNVTEMITRSSNFSSLSESGFEEEFSFDLSGPFTWLSPSQGGSKPSNSKFGPRLDSGPYFCQFDNVGMIRLGILFTDENDKLLGYQGATSVTQPFVRMTITLDGTSYKTANSKRFEYNIPALESIPFSYNVANEAGDCHYGEQSADFGNQMCYGDSVVDVGNLGIALPTPYRRWTVKVTDGNELLRGAKKVWVYADVEATKNLDMPCYKYPPPVTTWAELLELDYSVVPITSGEMVEWWVILLSVLGGLTVLAGVAIGVRKRNCIASRGVVGVKSIPEDDQKTVLSSFMFRSEENATSVVVDNPTFAS